MADLGEARERLSDENRALVERMESCLAISPQTADYLADHWGQANLLLNTAREEGRRAPSVDREGLRERLARIVVLELAKQDYGELTLLENWNLKLPWLDQGEVDFGLIADALIAALPQEGVSCRPSPTPEAEPLPAGSAASSPSVRACSEALEAAICAISDDDQRRAAASAFAYLRANLLGLQVASPEAGRVMAGALSFKSPYRNDMTVNVVDVLSALESWARTPRLGGVHNFTYGELEIGARMAREALARPTSGGEHG